MACLKPDSDLVLGKAIGAGLQVSENLVLFRGIEISIFSSIF